MKKTYLNIFFLLFILNPIYALAADSLLNIWLELGPNNQIIARAITVEKQCPFIQIDNNQHRMQIRANANKKFPVIICEAIISSQAKKIKIAAQTLKLPKNEPKKIVIIGDTGCRINNGFLSQNCNNPKLWPFAKIASQAAKHKPDLVIHVGDYLYREASCPFNNSNCANSPYGDTWATWQADFFKPAHPLLIAAPWVLLRGNHEDCHRAWRGWFRFLEPQAYTENCIDHMPPYAITFKELNLFLVDSSMANDMKTVPQEVKKFVDDFNTLKNSNLKNVWLITHKPIWYVLNNEKLIMAANTLQTAAKQALPTSVKLLFAGHIHRFEALNFAGQYPSQVIIGDSGTSLSAYSMSSNSVNEVKLAQVIISEGINIPDFGYMVMEKTSRGWTAQLLNPEDAVLANCTFNNQGFICSSPVKKVKNVFKI